MGEITDEMKAQMVNPTKELAKYLKKYPNGVLNPIKN